ncbi:MAG: nucleotidyl transferase AbiEii/AbiGii toxin family protein [Candidatus Omnitrophica bacterium]|nr:nucleotidyl transferase AbiEii/AbiGii toxin family protein [Candidatus Omnitrophota bacterium]
MFAEVLPGNTKAILALLGKNQIIQKAYLAGGTALALQLGHRISYDLDFFTQEAFDENLLLPEVEEISGFHLERISWRTIIGNFKGVKFSIFYYKYPLFYPFKKFGMINVADISDVAVMKITAIACRGTKRDFIDLYFICKEGISLKETLLLYNRKYKTLTANLVHIQKSLVYFEDAEEEEMPKMLKKVDWENVKEFFEREVKKLAKNNFENRR